MPRFNDTTNDPTMETKTIGGSHFQFSAAKIDNLGATEYTLVTIVADCSGSIFNFVAQIEGALKEVVRSCRRSPRADNLMLRVLTFDSKLNEVHGFKPLMACNDGDYTGAIFAGGSTALNDGAFNGAKALSQYGKDLVKQDFSVNGALFVLTDGEENASTASRKMVKDALDEAKTSESLESLMSVLIGVNTGSGGLNAYLDEFQKEAGFQQYVAIDNADEKTLAKLGGFISKSISSQSQALGTGGPSKSLTF